MNTQHAGIVMYTSGLCGYCHAARALLARRGVTWTEIRVDEEPSRRREMENLSGRRTVPQIFIDDRPVGGFDDLRALELAGELDALLAGRPRSA